MPAHVETVAGDPWNYRNRTQFHIAGTELGYLRARSHRLCSIEQCPISSPRINELVSTLREMLHDRRWPRFIRSLEVFTNEHDVQLTVLDTAQPVARRFFDWCAERIDGFVPGPLDYQSAGFAFRVGSRSFFQVNRYLVDRLIEAALRDAGGQSAADVFAGVGLFTLPLSRRFETVTAVESGSAAVRDLVFNLERAGLSARVEQSSAETYLSGLEKAPDFLLLDPPRAGLGKAVVRELSRLASPHVAIVACDPATLARDLRGLIDAGYAIRNVSLIDLFPQTFHLETVVHLGRA
jgi:23S rRNA (uracil1939-C5)-methyltransferase